MLLYLNVSALAFIMLVALAIVIASYKQRDKLFYLRAALLFIPAFAQIRQILALTGYIEFLPSFIYLVYFLLRLIGPFINAYAHILAGKKIPYKGVLFILTYLLFAYVLYDFFRAMTLPQPERTIYALNGFQEFNWFSFTFPIFQLAHIVQALFILRNSKEGDPNAKHFISIGIVTSIVLLSILQLGYLLTDREQVEYVLAPLIFIGLYSTLLIISIKYSSLYSKDPVIDNNKTKPIEGLSKRENEVLRLIADGKSDKEIADKLNLSVNTIATYCRRIYNKLEVNNRTEATAQYLKK